LFTIVNHVVSNARRGLARRREISLNQDVAMCSRSAESYSRNSRDAAPSHSAETKELASLVRGCIDRLVPRQRAAIELCDIEGLSYSHVAQAIGTSPDAAKSLIHRGRLNLKQLLAIHVLKGNVL
jgi:RNA polymerase sigma factor (sigma-70 family)